MSAAGKKSGLMAGKAAALAAMKREDEQKTELRRTKFYHGALPRDNVESELVLRKEGEWLLRYNDKERGRGFVISIRMEGPVPIQHIRVYLGQKEQCYYVRSDKIRKSVKALVEYHAESGEPLVKGGNMKLVMEKAVGRERWELNAKDIQLDKVIGQGAFGEVWKAKYKGKTKISLGGSNKASKDKDTASNKGSKDKESGTEVAVKVCKEQGTLDKLKFEKEAFYQLRFHHKNIVRTVGVVVSEPVMMIVLEYMPKGSLLSHLHKHKKTLSQARLRRFCVDAARGLAYVESHKVMHRDVAARFDCSTRNCLVGLHDEVKVADFGQAKSQETYKMLMGKVAVKWMAPESMRTGEFTTKTDVYSYGILMWEIFTLGEEPWSGLTTDQVRKKVVTDRLKMPIPARTNRLFADVMTQCWEYEPAQRPTFAQIVLNLQPKEPDHSADPGTDPA